MTRQSAFRGERLHIAVLGRCNTGKSSLLNCIVGQSAAIVSPEPGTTGDPVALGFELLPLGPVTFYDTAGTDENSPLGRLRRQAGQRVLAGCDLALLVTDQAGIGLAEEEIMQSLQRLHTPFLLVFNKSDLWDEACREEIALQLVRCRAEGLTALAVSAHNPESGKALKEALIRLAPPLSEKPPLLVDLLPAEQGCTGGEDAVIMVTPIDASAPAGRLIAPQVQALRELVEHGHPALVVQPSELERALALLRTPPALVVTDSQAVLQAAEILPPDIPLTTFSTLFARQKGDFSLLLAGAETIDRLRPDSKVLISEACAHHVQKDDIARVKIPGLLEKYLGFRPDIAFSAGNDFPDNLAEFSLVIHCGGCMLNPGEMRRRLRICTAAGVAATNFGMAISLMQGLLGRVCAPFA